MFVYVIQNSVNGKVYVGKSCMPAKRFSQHKVDAKTGDYPLHKAMRKYGPDAFEFSIVEQCCSEAESFEAEQRWVEKLNSTTRGNGYNQIAGGRGALRPTPEVLEKMRAAKLGKSQSAEHVEKRAASHRGKKRCAEAVKNLSQSDLKHRHITPAMCWELYSQGMSCRDVAARLGLASEQPVRRFLRLGGFQLRPSGRQTVKRRGNLVLLKDVRNG